MKTIILYPVMMVAASLLLANCGEEAASLNCTSSADCPDEALCHPHSQICVASCASSASVCSGTATPECRTTDNDPLENICICDANSCSLGEECNRATGLCGVPGGDDGTIGGQDCDVGSTGLPCTGSQVCIGDKTCAEPCNDLTTCIPSGQVCNEDVESNVFNICGAPDETAVCSYGCFDSCPERGNHTRDTNGPIIYDMVVLNPIGATANCRSPSTVRRFEMRVHSTTEIPTDDVFTDVVRRLDGGDEAAVFSDGPGTASHPTVESNGNDNYTARFSLCDAPGSMTIFSVFIRDESNRDSNGVCFRPDTMPF